MATTWRVTVEGTISEEPALLHARIQSRLDALEHIFSNWQSDSAINRWNNSTSTEFQPVPAELAELAEIALQIARETDGALDVTVAPLINLWGFGPTPPGALPPAPAAIHSAMQQCGWKKLEVRRNPPMLRKSEPGLTLNLSTLVEGYASDVIASMLQDNGHARVLVDVGGAINARGKAWTIAIQAPGAATGEALSTVQLQDEAVTTAGTYRKQFTLGEHAYSHIIDPRTGSPVTHNLVSVSVFEKRAVMADGYDTALLVQGPEYGRETATRLGLKTVFVTRPER